MSAAYERGAGTARGAGAVPVPSLLGEANESAAPAMREELLKVENVSLAFGGVKAIEDISFDITRGEIRRASCRERV